MKEILLINPQISTPGPNYFGPPYGLALIAAVLEKNGKEVMCLDLEKESFDGMLRNVEDTIRSNPIKYVGISCQSSNRGAVYSLINKIKNINEEIVVIIGGPFATDKYKLILENFPVDYIVLDDGEITFNNLIDCVKAGSDPCKVNGIAYMKENNIIKTPDQEKVKDLDKLPYPAFHLFDVEERLKKTEDFLTSELKKKKLYYLLGKWYATIPDCLMLLSSVGCIYNCTFCPMSGVTKCKYREHTAKYFVDMIEFFSKKYNTKHFLFGDNFFTRHPERNREICEELIARNLGIYWKCMTRTDYLDLELVQMMRKAGCIEISFGVESCSEIVQKAIGKNLPLDSVDQAFKFCEKAGMRFILMLMVGNMGETKETIYETLSRIKELEPDEILVQVTKIYPGTRIHKLCEEKGIISDDYYLDTNPEPELFTLENDESTIKKLRSMLKLRNVFFETNDFCNNNCVYCDKKKGVAKSTEELKTDILKIASRAHRITFCANEPLMRSDLLELVTYADKLRITKIQVETNARLFSYKSIINKFMRSRINKYIVPFFTSDEKLHDNITQTKGSFKQTVDGIRNICCHNSSLVEVKVMLFDINYKGLESAVDLLLSIGVGRFSFVYEPNKNLEMPSLGKLKPCLEKVLVKLSRLGKKFTVMGVPYCMIPDYEDGVDEIHLPFDEKYTFDGKTVNIGKERRKNKVKFDKCKKCKFNYICEGVWKGQKLI